jgi:hypothetical protein
MRDRPEISGNDVADEIEAGDRRHERREQLVRRLCEIMGWPYKTGHVYAGIRKVALAEAVAVGLDKLEEIVRRLEVSSDGKVPQKARGR